MNYNKKTIMDVDVAGKKILLRCDFNVPQDKETHAITSDKRIVASLPTIRYLLERGAAVIACSHLGKPKGQWKDSLTLRPVAERLSRLLGQEVIFAQDIVGEDAKAKAAALQGGQIMLLENLRFDPREEKNDPEFARELASMAELYVSDAFGTVHRAHASTAGVAAFLPAVSGLLVARELEIMVDNGCTVENVIVEHSVYGQLVGQLMLSSRYDVAEFIRKVSESGSKPLSDLTGGIHLHTLRCPDESAFGRVTAELREAGYLLE